MEDKSLLLDKVLFRFANPIDSDEEEDSDDDARWEAFERRDAAPSMTLAKERKEEFKIAFSIVADRKKTVSRDEVFDVLLAMGFTFQEDDMELLVATNCAVVTDPSESVVYCCRLLDGCITDDDDEYVVETLLEGNSLSHGCFLIADKLNYFFIFAAFEKWYTRRLKLNELKALFAMLTREIAPDSREDIIQPHFPEEYVTGMPYKVVRNQVISPERLKKMLNQILYKTGLNVDTISDTEVIGVLKEISTGNKNITFDEFVAMFRVY
jgi:hypothetical protein